ncbi:MAG: phage tail protein [Desulfovibrionaceae bacterium]|nr:phage tail protein [Desulfovibrionaceae bacterium]
MHLIDGAGHVNNQFVAEDAQTGRPPTEITNDWMNAVQNELVNFILSAGMSLNKNNNTQLRDALTNTFARRDGTIHYIKQVYNIVADPQTLGAVNTTGLPDGTEILVTSYYGLHQAALATLVGGAWIATPTPLNVFDLYGTDYDHHGYYWFSGTWNLFDVQTMQVDEATEEAQGIVKLATWAEVLAGSLAAEALRPRHMIDYVDKMFVGSTADFVGLTAPIVWVPLNGQLVSRIERPLLWQYAQGSGILVADSGWSSNTGKFSSGDGSTTFRVPDWRGEFRRSWDNGRGRDAGREIASVQGDAIRNIKGVFGVQAALLTSPTGPFTAASSGSRHNGDYSGGTTITFDASRVVPTASENRTRNLAYPTHIYAGTPA